MKLVRFLLPVLAVALIGPIPLGAQEPTGSVIGRVVDGTTQQPLSGVNVTLVGTTRGTLTRADGSFLLTGVPVGTREVRAALIGYAPLVQEAQVAAETSVSLQFELQPQAVLLDELVAVGYTTQRRTNVTTAVSTVNAEQIAERPVARVTEALQGTTPGLTVIHRANQPGRQSIQFNIRGRGSLNSTTPLILIDGIPGDINQINSQDIESITVLKDAGSTAIYGARAANGVILLTTKRGTNMGGVRMTYDGYYGLQNVAHMPDMVGPREYMDLINEAARNAGFEPRYTEDYIQNTLRTYRGEAGADPIQYPWTDWLGILFQQAPIQDHSFGVRGGNELARFNLSVNYFDHQGMTPQTEADRIALRLNTDFTLTDRLGAGVDLNLRRSGDTEPHAMGDLLFRMLHDTPPMVMARYPDGTYGWSRNNHNPLAYGEAYGLRERRNDLATLIGKLDYEVIDGLFIRTLASGQVGSARYKDWRNRRDFHDYFDPTIVRKRIAENQLWQEKDNSLETYLRAMADFNRTMGDHEVNVIAGYDQTANDFDRIAANRQGFYNNELRELNAGDAARDGTGGFSNQWRLRSGFGRVGYTFLDRYMVELNARYDGSSRFAKGNRFGFFPSASLGWRISEEAFFRNSIGFIDELKIRGSIGRTGNQDIGNYRYYSTINFGHNWVYGVDRSLIGGAAKTQLANTDVSWETTDMRNIGLDLEVLQGRLAFTGDLYNNKTTGILLNLPIPWTIGLGSPIQNAGSVQNVGWETAVNWRDRVGSVNYSIGFNLSDNRNKVLDLAGTGPYIDGIWLTEEGYPLGTMWGLQAIGLFVDEADVANHATQPSPLTGPGDIKYLDLNGDGVINNDDRTVVGNDLPRYTYGSNLNASWRNFDIGAFFQGVGRVDLRMEGALMEGPVWENYTTRAWLDRWTVENPNPNARMPKPSLNQHHNHGEFSSFWVQNAAYLKLKNAHFGYTLPQNLASRIGASGMRIYVSGQNVLTFTKADMLLDPEVPSGRGTVYPQTRTFSIGTSLQF